MDKKVEGGEGVQVQTSWMCFVFLCASISSYVFLFIYWSLLGCFSLNPLAQPSTWNWRFQEVAVKHGNFMPSTWSNHSVKEI